MNLGQMTLVILAAILFSIFILAVFNNLINQMEQSVIHLYITQGLKLADQVFQEYEAQILSRNMSFDDVFNALENGVVRSPVTLAGAEYTVRIVSQVSNAQGITIGGSLVDHQRIDVQVRIVAGERQYDVGRDDPAFSKVFSRFEITG
ncbi:MAG: hypothetical protein FWG98_06080 [Candidatus Cloacimonetes bacterium]|nr:hypothetical protein [Candidatus Cloacimonadota bacterium]